LLADLADKESGKKNRMRYKNETSASRKILTYFKDNPDVQQTLKGIVDWWLLQQSTESTEASGNFSTHSKNIKVISNQI
jgi:hypothetical protein